MQKRMNLKVLIKNWTIHFRTIQFRRKRTSQFERMNGFLKHKVRSSIQEILKLIIFNPILKIQMSIMRFEFTYDILFYQLNFIPIDLTHVANKNFFI